MATFTSGLAASLAGEVLERFDRYVRVDTEARRDRTGSPSTPGQLDLGRMLVEELTAIGIADAALDDNGYVTATLPANGDGPSPTVGLIAHLDVSPDAPAAGVEPLVHRNYDGGVIELPRGGTVLDPAAMPLLSGKAGEDIVIARGRDPVVRLVAMTAHAGPRRPGRLKGIPALPDSFFFDPLRWVGVQRSPRSAEGYRPGCLLLKGRGLISFGRSGGQP